MCAIKMHICWSKISHLESLHVGTVWTNLCIAMSCSDVYSPMCTVQLGKLPIKPGFVLPLRTRTSATLQSTTMFSDLYPLLLSPCLDRSENPALPYNSFFHISLPGVDCLLNMNSFFMFSVITCVWPLESDRDSVPFDLGGTLWILSETDSVCT